MAFEYTSSDEEKIILFKNALDYQNKRNDNSYDLLTPLIEKKPEDVLGWGSKREAIQRQILYNMPCCYFPQFKDEEEFYEKNFNDLLTGIRIPGNTIMIIGPRSSGKTHLLESIFSASYSKKDYISNEMIKEIAEKVIKDIRLGNHEYGLPKKIISEIKKETKKSKEENSYTHALRNVIIDTFNVVYSIDTGKGVNIEADDDKNLDLGLRRDFNIPYIDAKIPPKKVGGQVSLPTCVDKIIIFNNKKELIKLSDKNKEALLIRTTKEGEGIYRDDKFYSNQEGFDNRQAIIMELGGETTLLESKVMLAEYINGARDYVKRTTNLKNTTIIPVVNAFGIFNDILNNDSNETLNLHNSLYNLSSKRFYGENVLPKIPLIIGTQADNIIEYLTTESAKNLFTIDDLDIFNIDKIIIDREEIHYQLRKEGWDDITLDPEVINKSLNLEQELNITTGIKTIINDLRPAMKKRINTDQIIGLFDDINKEDNIKEKIKNIKKNVNDQVPLREYKKELDEVLSARIWVHMRYNLIKQALNTEDKTYPLNVIEWLVRRPEFILTHPVNKIGINGTIFKFTPNPEEIKKVGNRFLDYAKV